MRSRVEKAPNPRSSTRPPSASRWMIWSKKQVDDLFDLFGFQLGILGFELLDQFRTDHGISFTSGSLKLQTASDAHASDSS
jgi:hypothetical protein